jgi:hypothetical protein
MSWEVGNFIFGLGLVLLLFVVPLMGITIPRWLLQLLLVVSAGLMLAWPASRWVPLPFRNQETAAPQESLASRLAKVCKQPVVGLNRRPQAFLPIWIEVLLRLRDAKFEPDRTLQNLYNIKDRIRDPGYSAPDDFFRESLYMLRCLADVGQVQLEELGTTGTYGGKAFDNQRIVFQ